MCVFEERRPCTDQHVFVLQVSQYTFAMCSYREKKAEPQELMQLEGYTVDYCDPQPGRGVTNAHKHTQTHTNAHKRTQTHTNASTNMGTDTCLILQVASL